jgi:AraC-like DNA-binding protein
MLGTFHNWVEIVGRTLATEGVDLHAELARQGVTLGRSDLANERLDAASTAAVWSVVETQSADPVFGISMLRTVDYLDFEDLGVALLATGTAEVVLAHIVRYHGLLSDSVTIGLEVGQRAMELRIDHRATHWRASEFSAALVLRVLRARFDHSLRPTDVHLGFDNPAGLEIYRRYFRCPVVTGTPMTRLMLDRAALARVGMREPIGIAERFEQVLRKRVDELSSQQSVSGAVRAALQDMLGADAPTLDRVAATLHVSDRTLQRQLSAEGTSFATLLDESRRERAAIWLREGRLSRTEIAYLLGFSHPSSFSRAVRRWFPDG